LHGRSAAEQRPLGATERILDIMAGWEQRAAREPAGMGIPPRFVFQGARAALQDDGARLGTDSGRNHAARLVVKLSDAKLARDDGALVLVYHQVSAGWRAGGRAVCGTRTCVLVSASSV
jgi:hypothetical protein